MKVNIEMFLMPRFGKTMPGKYGNNCCNGRAHTAHQVFIFFLFFFISFEAAQIIHNGKLVF